MIAGHFRFWLILTPHSRRIRWSTDGTLLRQTNARPVGRLRTSGREHRPRELLSSNGEARRGGRDQQRKTSGGAARLPVGKNFLKFGKARLPTGRDRDRRRSPPAPASAEIRR